MSKVRYITPAVVVAAGTLGVTLIPAGQASANTKNDKCGDQVCLYYSAGAGSSFWESNESFAYPDFTSDTDAGQKAKRYDAFRNGSGAGTGVRNNAHSMANDGTFFEDALYSLPDLQGPSYDLGADHPTAVTLPTNPPLRNNDASYTG